MTDSEWLVEQRWFAAKTREVTSVDELDAIPVGDGLRLALLAARYATGTHDVYQVLRDASDAPDVVADPAAARAFAAVVAAGGTATGERSAVAFHWSDDAPAPSSARPLDADQSNTSIVLDERLVLKVFRRLEAGINPELELVRFLSAQDFGNIATLAGWYELTGDVMDATLGIAQELIADGRDGFVLATEEPDTVSGRAHELGDVIGRLHSVLGTGAGDPDFAPEEPSVEALSLLTATVDEQIERAFIDLPPDDERFAPIAGHGAEVRERLQLLSHTGVGGRLIRHHGDLHLGQMLLTPERWVVLDFEGEPSRPLSERRRKRSPLRDVAGMLRSFAYAASVAELPASWEDGMRAAFLEGYFAAVDPSLLPAGETAISKLLAIFELEKAIYELRYELDNRPDWVRIPVAGIARLIEEDA